MADQLPHTADVEPRHTASTITDPDLDRLYAELHMLRRLAAGLMADRKAQARR